MDSLERLVEIWKFYQRAKTRYDVHSPYLAALIHHSLTRKLSRAEQQQLAKIESIRSLLLKDDAIIEIEPMGAGSRSGENHNTSMQSLAKHVLSTPRQCRFYFKLIIWQQPRTILELGTSLGISTLYQHFAAPGAQMISIEGRKSIYHLADRTIHELARAREKKLQLWQGTFDEHLHNALTQLEEVDYAFIDGDHKGSSLKRYLKAIISYTNPISIIIVHDIRWSADMLQAWKEVINWPEVRASIEMHDMGLLLFNPSILTKQQIALIPTWLKPWRQGFFA